MNLTYIKRQIILNDLGIEIDSDIKKLIDFIGERGIYLCDTRFGNQKINIGGDSIGYYSKFFNMYTINDISIFKAMSIENNINMHEEDFTDFLKCYIEHKVIL